jgi:hypothetical protein
MYRDNVGYMSGTLHPNTKCHFSRSLGHAIKFLECQKPVDEPSVTLCYRERDIWSNDHPLPLWYVSWMVVDG